MKALAFLKSTTPTPRARVCGDTKMQQVPEVVRPPNASLIARQEPHWRSYGVSIDIVSKVPMAEGLSQLHR